MSGLGRAARVARARGSRAADFARGRGWQGRGSASPATLSTLAVRHLEFQEGGAFFATGLSVQTTWTPRARSGVLLAAAVPIGPGPVWSGQTFIDRTSSWLLPLPPSRRAAWTGGRLCLFRERGQMPPGTKRGVPVSAGSGHGRQMATCRGRRPRRRPRGRLPWPPRADVDADDSASCFIGPGAWRPSRATRPHAGRPA